MLKGGEHGSPSHDLPEWSEEFTDSLVDDLLRDLPELLEDFTENLVDQGVSASSDAPASISREPPHQELSRKSGIGYA